jgi:hypothetical protein
VVDMKLPDLVVDCLVEVRTPGGCVAFNLASSM